MPKMLKMLVAFCRKTYSVEDFAKKETYGNWAGYFRHAEKFRDWQTYANFDYFRIE